MSELPVGILLAAGQSKRFGSNKLMHPIDTTPMLMRSAGNLAQALPGSIVVINQQLIPYQAELQQLGLRVVLNEYATQGIGSSIACGVRASQHASGWLIALADMPYIKPATIRQLAEELANGATIVAPQFGQQRGHPVGFAQRFRQQLLGLHDDVGARQVIHDYHEQLVLLRCDDPAVVTDIDRTGQC